jgi:hypothetical protein
MVNFGWLLTLIPLAYVGLCFVMSRAWKYRGDPKDEGWVDGSDMGR